MEEDIKLVKELQKELSLYADGKKIKQGLAIEHLIKAYKELEEENEKLNQLKEKHNVRINDLCALVDNFAYNSIPVSLVEEKIAELKKLITEAQKELGSASKEYTIYVYQKDILQKLLEKRK